MISYILRQIAILAYVLRQIDQKWNHFSEKNLKFYWTAIYHVI